MYFWFVTFAVSPYLFHFHVHVLMLYFSRYFLWNCNFLFKDFFIKVRGVWLSKKKWKSQKCKSYSYFFNYFLIKKNWNDVMQSHLMLLISVISHPFTVIVQTTEKLIFYGFDVFLNFIASILWYLCNISSIFFLMIFLVGSYCMFSYLTQSL